MKKIFRNKKLVLSGFGVIMALGFGWYFLTIAPNQPVNRNDSTEIIFKVADGDNAKQIVEKLYTNKLIRDQNYAINYINSNKLVFYANVYLLNQAMKTTEILKILANPVSNMTNNKLVIYEGSTVEKTANAVEEITNGRIKASEFIALGKDEAYLKTLISEHWFLTDAILNPAILYPLEGYLAPATYPIDDTMNVKELMSMLLNATDKMLAPYQNKVGPNGYNLHQILALASIIERETRTKNDKELVSGVFYNRLNAQMPLQSDITVLYAMQEHKEIVTFKDLEIDSPYNLYINQGLTPGPVASPSIDAIDAAYNPAKTDYMYFFATQDTGQIIYSKTYEEHLKVAKENAWK